VITPSIVDACVEEDDDDEEEDEVTPPAPLKNAMYKAAPSRTRITIATGKIHLLPR
jgi:hypothetical protein